MPQKKTASSAPGLVHWMDRQAQILQNQAGLALSCFEVDAIHHARVATRRLRAAVDLIESVDKQTATLRRLVQSLRKVRRRFGPLRDLDVMLGHLSEPWAQGRLEAASKWARDQLIRQQNDLRERESHKQSVSRRLPGQGTWHKLMERARELEGEIRQALPGRMVIQLLEMKQRANALAQPGPSSDAAMRDPHALRIAGKSLRYTLEIADGIGLHIPGAILKMFKTLQDALGLWHDYAVLTQQILRLSLDADLAYHDRVLFEGTLELARTCFTREQQQLAEFGSLWKQHGPVIQAALEALSCPADNPDANGKLPKPSPDGAGLPRAAASSGKKEPTSRQGRAPRRRSAGRPETRAGARDRIQRL